MSFGETYVAYFGEPDQNDLHEHAVYQLVLSSKTPATIIDEHGTQHCGAAILVRPLVPHEIAGDDQLTLIYLDPQSTLATQLARKIEPSGIAIIPSDILPFETTDTPDQIVKKLQAYSEMPSSHIDNRLKNALDALGAEPGQVSIAEAANLCSISQSRLRTLVREQFGVPLSTWLLWRKLEKAARELTKGESLSHAALAGGFSDQAHFTRCMRRMFGISPTDAMESLSRKDAPIESQSIDSR